jgi:hypothetical protein
MEDSPRLGLGADSEWSGVGLQASPKVNTSIRMAVSALLPLHMSICISWVQCYNVRPGVGSLPAFELFQLPRFWLK